MLRLPKSQSHISTQSKSLPAKKHGRTRLLIFLLDFLFVCIIGRLFYWQVLHRSTLQAQAEDQYTRTVTLTAHRGQIFTSDGFPLVTNKTVYRLFAQPTELKDRPEAVAALLAPLLADQTASTSATPQQLQAMITEKLSDPKIKWVALKLHVDDQTKQHIDNLHLSGIGFDPYEVRDYPEASMAAHITGFVGKDQDGNDQGYFGVEGELDRELRGRSAQETFQKDALGFHLSFDQSNPQQTNGRDITLSIRRDVQHEVEDLLQQGMQKYEASAGEVIIMDPQSGKILAMADFPNYSQSDYSNYPTDVYKNPSLTETYEPGSTFKLITVAAGIDTGAITPDTQCTDCSHAREIDGYTIRTWNDQYHPNINMRDALAKSDNTAMIFAAQLIGSDRFIEYVKRFGIGDPTHVELQEDTSTPLRKNWKFIDLATSSFGQGIVTNGLQMLRAVSTIANHGVMMRPSILQSVHDNATNTDVPVPPVTERQVISADTASKVSQMMVYAVETGEAHWTASKTHYVAGKTGTAQVPIAGHYDKDKTIASFVGFAPPDNPKFAMIVKLRAPQSSPWAAETAAPLWFTIADKLFLLLNIPPDK